MNDTGSMSDAPEWIKRLAEKIMALPDKTRVFVNIPPRRRKPAGCLICGCQDAPRWHFQGCPLAHRDGEDHA